VDAELAKKGHPVGIIDIDGAGGNRMQAIINLHDLKFKFSEIIHLVMTPGVMLAVLCALAIKVLFFREESLKRTIKANRWMLGVISRFRIHVR